jgi:hypothetical protein
MIQCSVAVGIDIQECSRTPLERHTSSITNNDVVDDIIIIIIIISLIESRCRLCAFFKKSKIIKL